MYCILRLSCMSGCRQAVIGIPLIIGDDDDVDDDDDNDDDDDDDDDENHCLDSSCPLEQHSCVFTAHKVYSVPVLRVWMKAGKHRYSSQRGTDETVAGAAGLN